MAEKRPVGRPTSDEPTRVIQLRLPQSLAQEIESTARKNGLRLATYLTMLITKTYSQDVYQKQPNQKHP